MKTKQVSMKIIYSLLLCFFIVNASSAQPIFSRDYEIAYSGTNYPDVKTQSIKEVEDGYIVLGSVGDEFGGGNELPAANGGFGRRDVFIMKTDFSGTILWSKTFGSSKAETPRDLLIDGDNNIVIVGYTSTALTPEFNTSFGSSNMFVIKLNQSGNVLWKKTISNGAAYDIIDRRLPDNSLEYFIVGRTVYFGFSDAAIIKLNATTGDFVVSGSNNQAKGYSDLTRFGAEFFEFYSIEQLKDESGFIIVGRAKTEWPNDGNTWDDPYQLLVKIDNNLNILAFKKLAIDGITHETNDGLDCIGASKIKRISDGNFLVTGRNFYTYKINANLNILWTKKYVPNYTVEGAEKCVRFNASDIVEDAFGYTILGSVYTFNYTGSSKTDIKIHDAILIKIAGRNSTTHNEGDGLHCRMLTWTNQSTTEYHDICEYADMDVSSAGDRILVATQYKTLSPGSSQVTPNSMILSINSFNPLITDDCRVETINLNEAAFNIEMYDIELIYDPSGFKMVTALQEGEIELNATDECGEDCTSPVSATILGNRTSCIQPITLTTSTTGPIIGGAWNTGSDAPSLNISQIGTNTYTYMIVDEDGCTYTASASITISGMTVDPPAITNVTCNGDCDGKAIIHLNNIQGIPLYSVAPGNWSFSSFTNNLTGTNLCPGNYSITIGDGICSEIVTFTITEPPVLTASITTTPYKVCQTGIVYGSIKVTPTGGTPPYTVVANDNVNQVSYLLTYTSGGIYVVGGLEAGPYEIIVTDANGCTYIEEIYVLTAQCKKGPSTGIDDPEKNTYIIYPNPSESGVFTINTSSNIKSVTVKDISGRVVSTSDNYSGIETTVSIADQPKGIYIITIETENEVIVDKLIFK